MLLTLALSLAVQAAPVDGPKTKLGLPADTRPISQIIEEMYPDPAPFRGRPSNFAEARQQHCMSADSFINLSKRLKADKATGWIANKRGEVRELSGDDQTALDHRMIYIDAELEKHKLGCVR